MYVWCRLLFNPVVNYLDAAIGKQKCSTQNKNLCGYSHRGKKKEASSEYAVWKFDDAKHPIHQDSKVPEVPCSTSLLPLSTRFANGESPDEIVE